MSHLYGMRATRRKEPVNPECPRRVRKKIKARNYQCAAETAGRADHRNSVDYHAGNPYSADTLNWHAWRRGWRNAREQQIERVD